MNIKNPDLKVNSLIIIDSTQVTTDATSEGASDQNSVNSKNKNDIETNTTNISTNTTNINQKINQLILSDKTGKDLNLAYFGLKTDEAGNSTIIVSKSEDSVEKLDKNMSVGLSNIQNSDQGIELDFFKVPSINNKKEGRLMFSIREDGENGLQPIIRNYGTDGVTILDTYEPLSPLAPTTKKYVDSHTLNSFNDVNVLNPGYFTSTEDGVYPTNVRNEALKTASKFVVDAINSLEDRISTLEGTTKEQKLEIKKLRSLLNEKIR